MILRNCYIWTIHFSSEGLSLTFIIESIALITREDIGSPGQLTREVWKLINFRVIQF